MSGRVNGKALMLLLMLLWKVKWQGSDAADALLEGETARL